MALFRHLPDEIFRPLAAPNRAFYAALLLHLYDRTFTIIGDTPRRADVIAEIGTFIEDYAAIHELLPEDEVVLIGAEARDRDPRRYLAYHRLLQTGWLIEYRDRYRRLVDFDPDARLLLQDLARIAKGDTRSYGGAVLQVLGSLESAFDNPEERSEAIRNAARFSRDFMQHLRTVSAAMRKIEEKILAQTELRDLFRAVFEQLVEGYLIQDFKTLYTRNNPFRFRTRIIQKAWDIAENSLLLEALAAAYIREARAETVEQARQTLREELDAVLKVFESVDDQLAIIDETRARLERRIANTVRYMDRVNDRRLDRVTETLRAVAATPLGNEEIVDVASHMASFELPAGQNHLQAPRAPRSDIGRQRVRPAERDPAFEAYQRAKLAFNARVMVTPAKIEAYLERCLAGRGQITAAELAIETVDDFLAFQRLRELPYLFDGRFSERYELEVRDMAYESDWLICPDFSIRCRRAEEPAE